MEDQLSRIADAFESIAQSLTHLSHEGVTVFIQEFAQADGETVRVTLLNQSFGSKSYPFGIHIEED
jgi:hypothetical protein